MANYNTKNTKITSSDGQQQRKAELERRRSIRTIIASYEAEEEAFLKELEKMQAECEEENLTKLNNLTLNSSNEKQKLIENEEQQPAIMLGFVFEIIKKNIGYFSVMPANSWLSFNFYIFRFVRRSKQNCISLSMVGNACGSKYRQPKI
ncbi:unnamed protein product [Meloidogyne enterolobii]|uniref:Uncharacterized protein n=1 Tax=Meloidogyne enterolobii TaxID=390850 RepID=A0ACB0YYN8_MELEN